MSDTQLRHITSVDEREKVLTILATQRPPVSGVTEDRVLLDFEFVQSTENGVSLKIVTPSARELKTGEPLQLSFGVGEGQYFLATKVELAQMGTVMVPIDKQTTNDSDFQILQRRKNLRAHLTNETKVTYEISIVGTRPLTPKIQIHPIDLSAGGMRIAWPTLELGAPAVGKTLGGKLTVGKKEVELFGSIKTLYSGTIDSHVGIGFENLSAREEQSLLFICLDIRRRSGDYR